MEGPTTGCAAEREESVALVMVFRSLSAYDEDDIDDSDGHPGLRWS